MSVLIGSGTRVLIQGVTGKMATWVMQDMQASGTTVVAGVVPGRGGRDHHGVPVFDFVDEAVAATGANASLVFVPPHAALEAIREAFDAGIELVVYPGDGIPIVDAIKARRHAELNEGTLLGPNSPGLISPGRAKIGFMPTKCFTPGPIGVISKSGSLSYEVSLRLTNAGLGQSTVIGVGGDPVKGITMGEAIHLLHDDPETEAVLLLGEIGGVEEYQVARYAEKPGAKPVVAFLVGRTAPPGRKLGHAGALIGGAAETYAAKKAGLERAGVPVVADLGGIVPALQDVAVRAAKNGAQVR